MMRLAAGRVAPADDETLGLFAMIAASPEASDDFASVLAGTMRIPAFFYPANLERYAVPAGA
jgi:hypothetical protein